MLLRDIRDQYAQHAARAECRVHRVDVSRLRWPFASLDHRDLGLGVGDERGQFTARHALLFPQEPGLLPEDLETDRRFVVWGIAHLAQLPRGSAQ